jgi:hypothetical protein
LTPINPFSLDQKLLIIGILAALCGTTTGHYPCTKGQKGNYPVPIPSLLLYLYFLPEFPYLFIFQDSVPLLKYCNIIALVKDLIGKRTKSMRIIKIIWNRRKTREDLPY